jgi:hypothetical protein
MLGDDRADAVRAPHQLASRRATAARKERTMDRRRETRRERGAVAGIVLVVIGGVVLAARQAGFEAGNLIADGGWALFIIVPGVALLAAAFVPTPPDGLGFSVAGSVVTTVGLIFLYQQATENWDSWAYAWALIPMAAGIGITGYGLLTGHRDIAGSGMRLAAVAGVLFVIGAWYFNAVFETGENPIDIGAWWPVVVIGIGALVLGRAVLMPSAPSRTSSAGASTSGGDRP